MYCVRNDDFPFGTSLGEMKVFCELFDKYEVKLLHAIPIFGECWDTESEWGNEMIISRATHTLEPEKIEYLRSRNDLISVHGLYHSHYPTAIEIKSAKMILESWGLNPTWYTPPFNEYDGVDTGGLKLSVMNLRAGDRLEDYQKGMSRYGEDLPEFTYCHAWRWFKGWYKLEDLGEVLKSVHAKHN